MKRIFKQINIFSIIFFSIWQNIHAKTQSQDFQRLLQDQASSQICKYQNQVYDFITQQCIYCDSSCQNCSTPIANNCQTCKPELYLDQANEKCISKCENNQFINSLNQCQECKIYGCQKCQDATNCKICLPNFNLQNGQCILESNLCKQNEYYNTESEKCQLYCEGQQYQDPQLNLCQPLSYCTVLDENLSGLKLQNEIIDSYYIKNTNIFVLSHLNCQFTILNENLEKLFFISLLRDGEQNYNRLYTFMPDSVIQDLGMCFSQSEIIFYNFTSQKIQFYYQNSSQLINLAPVIILLEFNTIVFYSNANQIISFDMISLKFVLTSINQFNFMFIVNYSHKVLMLIDLLDNGLDDSLIIDDASPMQQISILDEQQLVFQTTTLNYLIVYQLSQDLTQINVIFKKKFNHTFMKFSISEQSKRVVITEINTGFVFIYIYNYTSNPFQYTQINVFQVQQYYTNYKYDIIKIQNYDYVFAQLSQDKFTLIKMSEITEQSQLSQYSQYYLRYKPVGYITFLISSKEIFEFSIYIESSKSRSLYKEVIRLNSLNQEEYSYVLQEKYLNNFYVISLFKLIKNQEQLVLADQMQYNYSLNLQISIKPNQNITYNYLYNKTNNNLLNNYTINQTTYLENSAFLPKQQMVALFYIDLVVLYDYNQNQILNFYQFNNSQIIQYVIEDFIFIIANSTDLFMISVNGPQQNKINLNFEYRSIHFQQDSNTEFFLFLNLNNTIYLQVDQQYLIALQISTMQIIPNSNKIAISNQNLSILAIQEFQQLVCFYDYYYEVYKSDLTLIRHVTLPFNYAYSGKFYHSEFYKIIFILNKVIYHLDLSNDQITYFDNSIQFSTFSVYGIQNNPKYVIINPLLIDIEHFQIVKQFQNGLRNNYSILPMQVIKTLGVSSSLWIYPDSINYSLAQNIQNAHQAMLIVDQNNQYQFYTQSHNYYLVQLQPNNNLLQYDFLNNQFQTINTQTNETIEKFYSDPINKIYTYTTSSGFYLINLRVNQTAINLGKFVISVVKFCPTLSLMVFSTQANQIYVYQVQSNKISQIEMSLIKSSTSLKRPLKFKLQCENDLLYIYSPYLRFYYLSSLKEYSYQIDNSQLNTRQCDPIIDINAKVIVYPFSQFGQFIQIGDNILVQSIFTFTLYTTYFHLDLLQKILIVIDVNQYSISSFDAINGIALQSYLDNYKFNNQTYVFNDQDSSLIILNSKPQIEIYFYNKNQSNSITKDVMYKNYQQILFESNKKIIFLASQTFIHTYQYPNLVFIESIVLEITSSIQFITLDIYLNLLFLQTNDNSFYMYDLQEILYQDEENIYQLREVEYLSFENSLILVYNFESLHLSLFQVNQIKDMYLFDPLSIEIFKLGELTQLQNNTFVFVNQESLFIGNIDTNAYKIQQIFQQNINFTISEYFIDFFQKQLYLLDTQNYNIFVLGIYQSQQINQFISIPENIKDGIILQNYIILFSDYDIMRININNQEIKIQYNILSDVIYEINKLNSYVKYQTDFFNYKQNNKNEIDNTNLILLICGNKLYTFDIVQMKLINATFDFQNSYVVYYHIDHQRNSIYAATNSTKTYIFNYALQKLGEITNPCLNHPIIQIDQKFIYSICPNSVLIYNAYNLNSIKEYSLNSYFKNIKKIQDLNYNQTFIIVQSNQLTLIQYQNNTRSNFQVIFNQEIFFLSIQNFAILFDQNHNSYVEIIGVSLLDIVKLTIPLYRENFCFGNIAQSNNIYQFPFQINTLLNSAIMSNQQVKVIEILMSDQFEILPIKLPNMVTQIQVRLVSQSKEKNTLIWSNQQVFNDRNINSVLFSNVSLALQNMGNFIINVNLDELIFKDVNFVDLKGNIHLNNFNKIIFENCKFDLQSNSTSLISVIDTQKLIFTNTTFINSDFGFIISNISEFYLINSQIINPTINIPNQVSLFTISQVNALYIQNVTILNITRDLQNFLFQIEQSTYINIYQINVNEVVNQDIFSLNGCSYIKITNTTVSQVERSLIFDIKNLQKQVIYTCLTLLIEDINIYQSLDISLNIVANYVTLQNSIFNSIILNQSHYLINLQIGGLELYKASFKSILSTDQSPKGQSVINMQQQGQITIRDLKIQICVSNNFLSVINLNQQSQIVYMEQLYLSDNKSPMQSIFLFDYLLKLVIKDSVFIKNKSFQNGGVMQIYEIQQFQLLNCTFELNQSTDGNGGAISYYNSNSNGLLNITKTSFVSNSALKERGGAIAMNQVDLLLQDVQMTNNKAVIGGAFYYQTLIPTIFLYKNYTNFNNNISNNIAYLYGNNIGSVLRKIDVSRMVASYDYRYFSQENQQIVLIDQFQSGSLLDLKNIYILDEEGNPFQIPKNIQFSSDILSFLSFVQIVVQTNETKIQILGSKYSQQQDQTGFNFNLNLAYFFNKSDSFILSTQSRLPLYDINGNNVIIPGDQQDPNSKFGCKQGYVGPLCEQCDQDGSIWGYQYFNTFQKNNCMKCNQNLFIFLLNSLICFGIISIYINYSIKKIIIQIEKQLLCHYLKLLDLIYFSKSARSDNSQSYSKIMIDHLQIVSIIGVQFQRIVPISYVTLSAGNPIEIYVNSITCFLPKNLQNFAPLWFQKVLLSFSLPLYTIIMYKIYNLIRHLIKKEKINQRYNMTALIFIYNYYYTSFVLLLTKSIDCRRIGDEIYSFIDLNIMCWNYNEHFKYIVVFILPALILISFVIPLFFLFKMRQVIIKKTLKTKMNLYFFLIGEYKQQFYYWELTKFLYKTLVIVALILLQDSLVIKACVTNSIMIFYLIVNIKIKPYDLQIFNELNYQSIIICLYTLNFSILYQQFIQDNYQFSWVVSVIAFMLNSYFFFKLLFQQYFKILPQQETNRNLFQKIVYYLKLKFPNCFKSVQMSNLIKLSTAFKIRLIKKNIKTLSQYQQYTQQEQSFKMTAYFSQCKNQSQVNQIYENSETIKSQEQQLALLNKQITYSNQINLLEFRQQQLKSLENQNSNMYSPQLKNCSSMLSKISPLTKDIDIKESDILDEDYSCDYNANQISYINQIKKNSFALFSKKFKQLNQLNTTSTNEKSVQSCSNLKEHQNS
ncbi:hypothetical protein ABPG73_006593 [Tetrahymena malaccensis]